MSSQVLLRLDDALKQRLSAAADRRGKSVQAILLGLAEQFLASEESNGVQRAADTRSWLSDIASDGYFAETTVEERDLARDDAWR
jgi:predicted transcriptional regulator